MSSESKARVPKRGLTIALPQMLLVVGVVIGLSVIIDFNRRIQSEQRIAAQAAQLRAEVTSLAATQVALTTELAYATSDAYVANWAHSEGRYGRPNEVFVVPVPANSAASTPVPLAAAAETPPSNFQIWWTLFFGDRS